MSFQDAMMAYVGRRKEFSIEQLSEETGIKARTLISYRDGHAEPPLRNFTAIMKAMPDGFKLMALKETGIIFVESAGPSEVCIGTLHYQVSRLTMDISEIRADGIVDHREVKTLQRRVPQTISYMNDWLSGMVGI